MLLTLASPNPYGYPECPAPQINRTLRRKVILRALNRPCFCIKCFVFSPKSKHSTCTQLASILFYSCAKITQTLTETNHTVVNHIKTMILTIISIYKKWPLYTKRPTQRWCKHVVVDPKKEDTTAQRKGKKGETEKHRGRTGTGVRAGDCGVGPFSWESGLNLTAGNTTTVCLQAVTEAQAAPRAAPTPHSKSTSLTDGGSDVTGPHIRPVCASRQWKGIKEKKKNLAGFWLFQMLLF